MTIGIATYGPNAGGAAIAALRSVEAIGRGAISGFVSLAIADESGAITCFSCQNKGTGGLFVDNAIPDSVREAKYAALMSSGPNRPEPLQNFTPSKAETGIITGHRMPNTTDGNGSRLNDLVLELVQNGMAAQLAMEKVLNDNPNADAGFLMLSFQDGLFAANAKSVTSRADQGLFIRQDLEKKFGAGAIHNAIEPNKAIANLAVETALDYMFPSDNAEQKIIFAAGVELKIKDTVFVNVNTNGVVQEINVTNSNYLSGECHIGIGFEVPVFKAGRQIGKMKYEPFMQVIDGVLVLIDGFEKLSVAVGS